MLAYLSLKLSVGFTTASASGNQSILAHIPVCKLGDLWVHVCTCMTVVLSVPCSMLATKLNMSSDDAEKWIVNLIRNAKLDAKIDAKEVSLGLEGLVMLLIVKFFCVCWYRVM